MVLLHNFYSKNYIPQLHNYVFGTAYSTSDTLSTSGRKKKTILKMRALFHHGRTSLVFSRPAVYVQYQKVHVAKMEITKLMKLLHWTTGAHPGGRTV